MKAIAETLRQGFVSGARVDGNHGRLPCRVSPELADHHTLAWRSLLRGKVIESDL
jgi:hypothetical protein